MTPVPTMQKSIDDKYGLDVDDISSIHDILPTCLKEKYTPQPTHQEVRTPDEVQLGFYGLKISDYRIILSYMVNTAPFPSWLLLTGRARSPVFFRGWFAVVAGVRLFSGLSSYLVVSAPNKTPA